MRPVTISLVAVWAQHWLPVYLCAVGPVTCVVGAMPHRKRNPVRDVTCALGETESIITIYCSHFTFTLICLWEENRYLTSMTPSVNSVSVSELVCSSFSLYTVLQKLLLDRFGKSPVKSFFLTNIPGPRAPFRQSSGTAMGRDVTVSDDEIWQIWQCLVDDLSSVWTSIPLNVNEITG